MSPLAVLPRARVSGELECWYCGRFQQLAQVDGLALLVGDLDADGLLAQDALDAHVLGLDHQGQVLGQAGDVLDLDADVGDELEGGDHRSGRVLGDLAVDLELLQPLRQLLLLFLQLVDVDLAFLGGGVQVGHGRRLVLGVGPELLLQLGENAALLGQLAGLLDQDPFFGARRGLPFSCSFSFSGCRPRKTKFPSPGVVFLLDLLAVRFLRKFSSRLRKKTPRSAPAFASRRHRKTMMFLIDILAISTSEIPSRQRKSAAAKTPLIWALTKWLSSRPTMPPEWTACPAIGDLGLDVGQQRRQREQQDEKADPLADRPADAAVEEEITRSGTGRSR